MCVRAILLLVDPINCSVRSANKGGAQAPRAPPLATPLAGVLVRTYILFFLVVD